MVFFRGFYDRAHCILLDHLHHKKKFSSIGFSTNFKKFSRVFLRCYQKCGTNSLLVSKDFQFRQLIFFNVFHCPKMSCSEC